MRKGRFKNERVTIDIEKLITHESLDATDFESRILFIEANLAALRVAKLVPRSHREPFP
jgi:hypothetical protein